MSEKRILVIRLGALGDLVLCGGAFAAIRAAHPDAHIALLTMPAFEKFALQMPWFDEVLTDSRPSGWRIGAWLELAAIVKQFAPQRVYDLQGKKRQSVLFNLLGGPLWGPEWSGAAFGCSHPRLWPPIAGMHFTQFVSAQLVRAGIKPHPVDSKIFSWLDGNIQDLGLAHRFMLLIPGCAPDRLYKRWSPVNYAALAEAMAQQGISSVAIGTEKEANVIRAIKNLAPDMLDMTNKTSLGQVAALARHAVCVVGNDTGPTHLAAAAGGKTLALLSGKVDPAWSAPNGPTTAYLQGDPIDALTVDQVMQVIRSLITG